MSARGRVLIGLDPSSKKIALAISVGGAKPTFRTKALPQNDMPRACKEAYKYVRDTVKEFTKEGHRVFVFIEEPVVGRGGVRSTLMQTKANGAMQAGASMAGALVQEVNNSSWKKRVVGKGNCGKPEVKEWLRQNWPYAYVKADGDQDIMDAACILRFGEQFISVKEKIDSELA